MRINAKDYFPITTNTTYIYTGSDYKFLNFKQYTDFCSDTKSQIRFNNGHTEVTNVYEYSDTGINLICCRGNENYHQSYLETTSTLENYLIKNPIAPGNSWKLPNGSERCITSIDAEVNTRYKLFKSVLEIVTLNKSSEFTIDYYAEGIGLIKSVYYINNVGFLCSELEDIIENSPTEKKVKTFFPDTCFNSLWFSEKNINFYTNDDVSLVFSTELENAPKGLTPLINCNTKINKMYYDYPTSCACIELSSDILESFNTKKESPCILFSAIYKTMQEYYKTSNVSITIDSKDIQSYFSYCDFTKLFSSCVNESYQKWFIEDCNLPLTYIAKEDDTLLSISRKFNIDYKRLAKLNNITNPNFIPAGTVLQIYSNGLYSVKPNETLYDICSNFNLNLEHIIESNNISDPSLITSGQKIKLY